MRFSSRTLSRIRERCGPDFVIGVCVSVDPTRPDVLSVEDQQAIAAWHDERGLYDYVTVGTGSYFEFTRLMPTFVYEDKLGPPYAERIKQAVRHAKVQSESHIRTPENADSVIGSGQADMVSIVRGQIADPHMANKAREGRAEDVRPCLSCNQMCWGRRSRDYWVSCLVNPSAGREFEWGGDRFARTGAPRSVLVVGGGPAGLEAARVAAERGHRVTLAEASDKLGGQFRLAGMQPRRAQILDLIDWYERQLTKLQVVVRLNAPLEPAEIDAFDPDVVILATGSLPAENGWQRGLPTVDRLPGIERGGVFSVEDIMSRAVRPGHRVIVLDDTATWRGGGTAWHLAERGHAVTIVTSDPFVGREIVRTSADWPLRERLRRLGVDFVVESAVKEWHGDSATVIDLLDESERRIEADALVLATVNAPERFLCEALATSEREVHAIGDCVAARQAPAAIYEGRKLALGL